MQGLTVKDIRKFVNYLLAISYAVDEKDWERLKSYRDILGEIEEYTNMDIMGKAIRSLRNILFALTENEFMKAKVKGK